MPTELRLADTSLYVPASYYVEKAVEAEKADVGPGFGPNVQVGPGGVIARFMNNKRSNRYADKALYYYLYTRHPIVYSCVELIVQAAAQDRHTWPQEDAPGGGKKSRGKIPAKYKLLRRQLEDDGDEGDLGPEPQDGVEFLETFFATINEFESFADLLAATYRDALISGEAFWLKQRLGARVAAGPFDNNDSEDLTGGGRVDRVVQNPDAPLVAIHRIPSRDTFAVPGKNGYPAVYRQRADGGGYREYAAEDVVFFTPFPNPYDAASGLAPLEALDLSLATDISAAKYNEAYFRNGAKAGIILSMQGATTIDVRRNREWLNTEYVKPENAHRPMLLQGNIELVREGNRAQNDMEFTTLRRFTREEICAVYSVPLSKLLHTDNPLGQAGKVSDDVTFRADTVGPLQTHIYEAINRQLMKRDFPTLPLLIPPRQEKVRLDMLEAAMSLVKVGGTGNEARAVLHLPESPEPEMNKPLFFTPALRTLEPDDPTPGLNQQRFGAGGSSSDAARPDRTSQRTSSGVAHARVRGGRGMTTRKAGEDSLLDDGGVGSLDDEESLEEAAGL